MRVDGDLALFAGVNKVMLEREEAAPGTIFDREFITNYCDGFEAACDAWRALDWSVIESQSGLTKREVECSRTRQLLRRVSSSPGRWD